jgi:hypothetical protein
MWRAIVVADFPLILLTGLPEAGVSTRTAALHLALGHDNRFKAYEINRAGGPIIDSTKANKFDFLDHMMRRRGSLFGSGRGAHSSSRTYAPLYLSLEARNQKKSVEIWERSFHDAIYKFDEHEFDGIVISVPLQVDRDQNSEKQLDSLIRPLRRKYWIEFKQDRIPWIIFDLTQYDSLFGQLTPEMLNGLTPYSFAAKRTIQEIATRSFCQRWIGDNEITHLANAEKQRCSIAAPNKLQDIWRVMVQVSTAWGFLRGDSGPSVRGPANFRHATEVSDHVASPRFPDLTDTEREMLATMRLGVDGGVAWAGLIDREKLEGVSDRFFQAWKPLGIVEPIPSVIWREAAPNMFWLPEVMLTTESPRPQERAGHR